MISEYGLTEKLHKESMRWKRELKTEYVEGVIRGLAIAVSIVKEIKAKEAL